jgi:hypothetical protein
VDFGDLIGGWRLEATCQSPTRGVAMGGFADSPDAFDARNQFITIATTGNATLFGELTAARGRMGGGGNATRGVALGGDPAPLGDSSPVIDFLTIASLGNSNDFGDLTVSRMDTAVTSSPTRVVACGGYSPVYYNTCDYITIATTGDAVDFGDIEPKFNQRGATSNAHGGLG